MFIIPEFNASQVGNVETYKGRITCLKDALLIVEATRLGILPKIKRRLNEVERQYIVANTVFAWNETECGMKRWTDGKNWLASKVHGSFLVYKELDTKRKVKKNGLIKQSFSLTTKQNQKIHLIYYAPMDEDTDENKKAKVPSWDPKLKDLNLKANIYHDNLLCNDCKLDSKRETSIPSSPGTNELQTPIRSEAAGIQLRPQTLGTKDSRDSISLRSIEESPTNILADIYPHEDEIHPKRMKPSPSYISFQPNSVPAYQQCQLQQPAIIIPQHIVFPQGPHYMVQQVPVPYQASPNQIQYQASPNQIHYQASPNQVPVQIISQPPLRQVPPPLIKAKSGPEFSMYYYSPVYDPSQSPTFSTFSQPTSSVSSPITSVRGSVMSVTPNAQTSSTTVPPAPLHHQSQALAKKYSYNYNSSDSQALKVLDRGFSVR